MKTVQIYDIIYVTAFLLEREMLDTSVVEKIKMHILCSITFSHKPCCLWDNVEKYGKARQATNDDKIWPMHFASWKTKARDTHSEYVIVIAFPRHKYIHCLCCSCCTYCHVSISSTHHRQQTNEYECWTMIERSVGQEIKSTQKNHVPVKRCPP